MSFMDKFSADSTTSSNSYAQGSNQNCGNVITGRSTTRIHHAPGGASSFSFAQDPEPIAQPTKPLQAPVVEPEPEPEVGDEPDEIPFDAGDYKALTLGELRGHLRERGLNPGGGKDSLLERLNDGVESGQVPPVMKKNPAKAADSRPGTSNNNYARADGQNNGNFLTDRNSSRVLAAPGGASSVMLGTDPSTPHISNLKRQELTGHNIFSERAEDVRSTLGGVRKDPGGGSSIMLG
ncbi:hypothetical protein CYMTET_4336 [Cymbomonas tetramitiformis]|uniref:SAP domain-containing protein n=1 Tax=Cymbomonas tetramitiformis TaxID=36881 RepID=A0AAE0H1J3_9CHLO|nr:hypothetical protein CYMTET_4336 [Cymbomonas tetramitiformis]